jgi:hypothetical protein
MLRSWQHRLCGRLLVVLGHEMMLGLAQSTALAWSTNGVWQSPAWVPIPMGNGWVVVMDYGWSVGMGGCGQGVFGYRYGMATL